MKRNPALLILVLFLLVPALLRAADKTPGKKALKTDSPADFKSPYTYVTGAGAVGPRPSDPLTTRRGIRHTAKWGRIKALKWRYTRLNFPMKAVFGKVKNADSREHCLICHRGVESISANHPFKCSRCHGGNPRASEKKKAHAKLVPNPSDFSVVDQYCGECHREKITRLKNSLMSTAAGEINITRYYWGSQSGPLLQSAALDTPALKKLPEPDADHPVDGLLRKKCLRCHLNSPAPARRGDYRSTGCAACHMIYGNDGKYHGSDKSILAFQASGAERHQDGGLHSPRGFPVLHRFTTAIPTVQCVHCHNGNRVGTEYLGYFEEGRESGSAGSAMGKPLLHGAKQTYLRGDIHEAKGMHCIDCHTQGEVEGTEAIENSMRHGLKIKCEDCHGLPGSPPRFIPLAEGDKEMKVINANANLKKKIRPGAEILVTSSETRLVNVVKKGEQAILISKVTGQEHAIPLLAGLKIQPPAHRISSHLAGLECHACHARWSSADWGMRLAREEYVDVKGKREFASSDPALLSLFHHPDQSPETLDWLSAAAGKDGISGKLLPGIWWDSFDTREWDAPLLGLNSRGRVSLLKPNYQYFYTHRQQLREGDIKRRVTVQGERIPVSLDGRKGLVMRPYAPHTIQKEARPCEACHGNASAVGLGASYLKSEGRGPDLSKVVGEDGSILQSLHGSDQARFLNKEERDRLLNTDSKRYRYFRYLSLERKGWTHLLKRFSGSREP